MNITRIPVHALTRQAIRDLNQTTTQEARRQLLKELPRPALAHVRAHFASYGDCFPIGQAVTELIDRQIDKVQ